MIPGDCAACSTGLGICSAHEPMELLEIERLRELMRVVEWAGTTPNEVYSACPWCRTIAPSHDAHARHRDECPAFSDLGVVR